MKSLEFDDCVVCSLEAPVVGSVNRVVMLQ